MDINKYSRYRRKDYLLKEEIFANDMSNKGLIPKQMKILIQKYTCTTMFIAALFTIAKIWCNLSIDQQLNG